MSMSGKDFSIFSLVACLFRETRGEVTPSDSVPIVSAKPKRPFTPEDLQRAQEIQAEITADHDVVMECGRNLDQIFNEADVLLDNIKKRQEKLEL